MKDFKVIKDFVEGLKDEAVRIEKLLTSIPAMAPESDGDGEEKKAISH